jgi:hypothetical protein
MDFGGFIMVGLLGMAFGFFVLLAIVISVVYRKTPKLILICAAVSLLLFLASGSWIFYKYILNEPLAMAGEGNISTVRFLLKFAASPNAEGVASTPRLRPPLNTEIVRLLLQRGADPSRKDGGGHTPLECARRSGSS